MIHAYREWNHLSTRIKALLETGIYLFNAFQVNKSDSYGALKTLVKSSRDIYSSIIVFQKNYSLSLPTDALECLEKFISDHHTSFTTQLNDDAAKLLLVALSTLEAEISHYLRDTQTYIRKTAEVAFAHLQRQLVVDKDLRKKWGINIKEESFESLGAIHLLSHRIWAFKAYSLLVKGRI